MVSRGRHQRAQEGTQDPAANKIPFFRAVFLYYVSNLKLTPGTVCIVLAGRFRGKRVVMLKQINDTILVTGPFKINGVPLRRINPAYVIATSTKVELPSGLSLDKFDEAYFKVKKEKKGKSSEQEFFGEGEKVWFIQELR